MNTFSNIKELLRTLHRESELLTEMFTKRKTLSFKYDMALSLVKFDEGRLQHLLSHSVITQNDGFLEIDAQFLDFFEQILGVNEEINISYINENLQNISDNIVYYLQEENPSRQYNYLRVIKNTFKKIGLITVRNVVDLRRNIDTTFKNEPNYKNKKTKLENLDNKRVDIAKLIAQTQQLMEEKEPAFFKSDLDEEFHRVITQLKIILRECIHNLIEIEKQVIDYLNQIKQQSGFLEKLRKIKYLKDQFIIESSTNIKKVLVQENAVMFENRPAYQLKLSMDTLNNDQEAFESIQKIALHLKNEQKFRRKLADKISLEYLEDQVEEDNFIDLEALKNNFVAGSNDLFTFIMHYGFLHEVSFNERVALYCQIVSQYETELNVTDEYRTSLDVVEYALVYPK